MTAVAITVQNSSQVAGAAYQSVNYVKGSSNSGASTFVKSVVVGGAAQTPSLANFARRQIGRFVALGYTPGADSAMGITQSLTLTCDTPASGTAGSISVKWNDADNSLTFTSGDTLSATLNNCYSSADGQTVSGGFALTGFTVTGNPQTLGTAWSATATFTFTNLSITDASGTQTANGGFTYSGSTQDGITITTSLKGSSVSIQKSGGATLTLEGFDLSGTDDQNTTEYTLSGTGRVSDSTVGGYVTFFISSVAPLQGSGGLNPRLGNITITGANNSSVTLIALDTTNVQLKVDANGDGIAETTVAKTWSQLSP